MKKRGRRKGKTNKLDKRLGRVDFGDSAALGTVEQPAEHDTIAKKGLQRGAAVLEACVPSDLKQKHPRVLFVYCILVVGVICVGREEKEHARNEV